MGLILLIAGLLWWAAEATAAEERLLPGTTVAGFDVGERTVQQAAPEIERALDAELDRQVAVEHDDERWEVTLRELGASPDTDATVVAALEQTSDLPIWEVGLVHWFGGEADIEIEPVIEVPDAAVDRVVEEIADDLDRPEREASLEWTSDGIELVEDRIGVTVERGELRDELEDALLGGETSIEVPVQRHVPAVRTPAVEAAQSVIEVAVEEELQRTVEVSASDHTYEVAFADLEPIPDLDDALDAVLGGARTAAGDVHAAPDVGFTVQRGVLEELVREIADEVDRAVRNARVDWSSGWIELTEERSGRELDVEEAVERIEGAFLGGEDAVDLPVQTVEPELTTAAYRHVLLLRQDLRRLYLYEDGEIIREWPVAIGTAGSPTPTGTFTVGQKRFMPTWVNPAPDGWGSDMPEVVGPGPDNPLGVRALNWNRNGADTLIRFHGTPEIDSIGQAASRGCVRLTNRDVTELYDLVPSGTKIVSIGG